MKRTVRLFGRWIFMAASAWLCIVPAVPASAESESAAIREDFNNLDNWRPFRFPKIEKCSTFTIVRQPGTRCLKLESDSSASGLVFTRPFPAADYSKLRWRWKVENVYRAGDAKKKSGDDFPVRLYVLFKCPEKAGFIARQKSKMARQYYGDFPAHSALSYVWANRPHKGRILTSRYIDDVKLILCQKGEARTGKWIVEESNFLKEYERAFGDSAPAIATLALMCDSDNTGESSVAYIDYIELLK